MEKETPTAEEVKKRPHAGLLPFGIVTPILGFTMIGLLIPYLTGAGLSSLQALFAEAGSPYATDFLMPYIMLGGAGLSVVAGIVSIIGALRKSRMIGIVAVILALVAAGLKIGPAAYLESVLTQTFNELQSSPFQKQFSAKEQSLLDISSALFNECCFKVYDTHCGSKHHSGPECVFDSTDPADFTLGTSVITSNPAYKLGDTGEFRDNQLPVRVCGTEDESCPTDIYPPVLDTVKNAFASILDVLCLCYSNQQTYDKIVEAMDRLDSCTEFSKIIVENVGGVEIPTAAGLTFGQLPGIVGTAASDGKLNAIKEVPLDRFAVVGKTLPPQSIFGEPEEAVGWSCGLGYAKGMTFAMYLGIKQAADIGINGAYGVGGIEAFLAIVLVVYWLLGGGNDTEDEWESNVAQHYEPPRY